MSLFSDSQCRIASQNRRENRGGIYNSPLIPFIIYHNRREIASRLNAALADRKGKTRVGANGSSFHPFRSTVVRRTEASELVTMLAYTRHDGGILSSGNPRHSAAQCEYYGKGKMDSRMEERRVSAVPVIRG